jgi:nucleoside phosphorylase
MTVKFAPIDLVILTVLPEEYQAVKSKLSKCVSPSMAQPNMYAWVICEINSSRFGRPYSVALGMIGRAGNVSGALATEEAIKIWNPQCVFFVGIAGGFDRDNLAKGDVVLADVVYGYEYGKLESKFIPRQDQTFRSDLVILNQAVQFALDQSNWVNQLESSSPLGSSPKVIRGNIASGEKVVDDPTNEFFSQVQQTGLKLHAVEMEGAGATAAVEQARALGSDPRFLMIRGISDMPKPETGDESRGTSERDEWKTFAAQSAAAFTVSFIAKGLAIPPRKTTFEPVTSHNERMAVFGLIDEDADNFGKCEFTNDVRFTSRLDTPLSQAPHNVIIAALPLDGLTGIKINVLRAAGDMLKLENWYKPGQQGDYPPKYWPHSIFKVPTERRAAKNALVWEDKDLLTNAGYVFSRLVVTNLAEVMFVSAFDFVDVLTNGTPVFRISDILAKCWKLSGLVAQLYQEIEYDGRTLLCIGMVNTLNSHLGSFTDNWLEPYNALYWRDQRFNDNSCHSSNLKFCQPVDLREMTPKEQPEFIIKFAEDISIAYNHDIPRCLERDTGLISEKYLSHD